MVVINPLSPSCWGYADLSSKIFMFLMFLKAVYAWKVRYSLWEAIVLIDPGTAHGP